MAQSRPHRGPVVVDQGEVKTGFEITKWNYREYHILRAKGIIEFCNLMEYSS
jgi:hypothetical protein